MAGDSIPPDRAPKNTGTGSLFHHPMVVAMSLWTAIFLVQWWVFTCGTWWAWPPSTHDYCKMTDAFLHGQVSMRITPPPAMLALPNPYDPQANFRYRWHDASLFNGKYYLYWGPAPALIAAAVCASMRISDPTFSDQYLYFLFVFGTVLMATLLMLRARASWFPGIRAWAAAPVILSLGLSVPILCSGWIYGAAIAAGQFFLLTGIYAAWRGLSDGRWRMLWLFLAGVCWTLSAGSRISLPPAVATIAVICCWMRFRSHPSRGLAQHLAIFTAVLTPMLIGAALMGWYNFARFGSILEFGWRYQLASVDQYTGSGWPVGKMQCVVPNAARYLFEPPIWIKQFPYVMESGQQQPTRLDALFALPWNYSLDLLIGVAWSQPFLVFAIIGLAMALRRRSAVSGRSRSNQRLGVWLIAVLWVGAFLGMLPSLTINLSGMHYLLDLIPCCTVLAGLGYWQIISAGGRAARWVPAAGALLVLGQCVMSMFLVIGGPDDTFARFNPELYNAISSFFNNL
jgi:hypothetical protein